MHPKKDQISDIRHSRKYDDITRSCAFDVDLQSDDKDDKNEKLEMRGMVVVVGLLIGGLHEAGGNDVVTVFPRVLRLRLAWLGFPHHPRSTL